MSDTAEGRDRLLETITPSEIRSAAERALEYQRYLFRRAYGLFYLVWAAALALLTLTSSSILTDLSAETEAAFVVFASTILIGAVFLTARIFRNARRSLELRSALRANRERRSHAHYFLLWFAAVYGVVLLADVLLPAYSQDLLYALLLPVPFLLYSMLGVAFPEGRPAEGITALAVYGGTVVLNLVLSVAQLAFWVTSIAWAVTASVWLAAAFYGIWRAPAELEARRV